jgi:hypothetical protein
LGQEEKEKKKEDELLNCRCRQSLRLAEPLKTSHFLPIKLANPRWVFFPDGFSWPHWKETSAEGYFVNGAMAPLEEDFGRIFRQWGDFDWSRRFCQFELNEEEAKLKPQAEAAD